MLGEKLLITYMQSFKTNERIFTVRINRKRLYRFHLDCRMPLMRRNWKPVSQ